jgi:hypothetical protein
VAITYGIEVVATGLGMSGNFAIPLNMDKKSYKVAKGVWLVLSKKELITFFEKFIVGKARGIV